MKASKFSDVQKAFILKQGDDGVPVKVRSQSIAITPGAKQRQTATGEGLKAI